MISCMVHVAKGILVHTLALVISGFHGRLIVSSFHGWLIVSSFHGRLIVSSFHGRLLLLAVFNVSILGIGVV